MDDSHSRHLRSPGLREDFLYYYEKYLSLSENDQKLLPPPPSWDPFVKQTYSAWVTTAEGDRKWHLTAYYTDATRDDLKTIDDFPLLKDIVIPDGHFRSNADVKTRKDDTKTASVSRTFAPFHPHYSMTTTSEPKSYEHVSHSTSVGVFDTQGIHHASLNLKPSHVTVSGTPYPPSYAPSGAGVQEIVPGEPIPGPSNILRQRRSHHPTTAPFILPADTGDELACSNTGSRLEKQGSRNSSSIDLVPLHMVLRHHPYRRDPLDDKALRLLGSRA